MAPPDASDYNAFGFDPNGSINSAVGLLFGPDWRPDGRVPTYEGSARPAAPRFGPAHATQLGALPAGWTPRYSGTGYSPAHARGPSPGPSASGSSTKDKGKAPAKPARVYPNTEISPGSAYFPYQFLNGYSFTGRAVFCFNAYIRLARDKPEVPLTTASSYHDTLPNICKTLGSPFDKDNGPTDHINWRLVGAAGGTRVGNEASWWSMMAKVREASMRARTKAVALEFINMVRCTSKYYIG